LTISSKVIAAIRKDEFVDASFFTKKKPKKSIMTDMTDSNAKSSQSLGTASRADTSHRSGTNGKSSRSLATVNSNPFYQRQLLSIQAAAPGKTVVLRLPYLEYSTFCAHYNYKNSVWSDGEFKEYLKKVFPEINELESHSLKEQFFKLA